MADPTKPTIDYSYTGFQQEQQEFPFPGTQLDNDLANLVNSVDQTIDALKDVRRADGALKNGIVTNDSLSPDLLIGIEAPTDWAPSTAYNINSTVYEGDAIYRATVSHLSGASFATDLANGKWEKIVDFSALTDAAAASAAAAAVSETNAAGSASSATTSAATATTQAGIATTKAAEASADADAAAVSAAAAEAVLAGAGATGLALLEAETGAEAFEIAVPDDAITGVKIADESEGLSSILLKLGIDRAPDALPKTPQYTPTSSISETRVLINGSTENGGSPVYHRHFGSIIRDHTGVLHVFYRRALGHATYFEGDLCHVSIDHDGNERSAETVILAHGTDRDLHSPMAVVTPSGRIVLTFCDVQMPSAGNSVDLRSMYSDDNCGSWSSPTTFYTDDLSRTYGQPRIVPSDVAGERWRILQPWYGRDAGGTNRRIGIFESTDNGEVFADLATPIYEGADLTLSETSIACLNAKVWFAAMRKNGGRLHWAVTTNAGASWTAPTVVTWGTTLDIAPSLDIIFSRGVPFLLLGYCDRSTDQTKWRWAKASSLMTNAEAMGKLAAVTSAADMIEASGYQVPYIYPNGQMLFVEFEEYVYGGGGISDPAGSDVRLVWANPGAWVDGHEFSFTPTIVGASTPGSPTGVNTGTISKDANGLVSGNLRIALTSKGGMVGQLKLGLPYTNKTGNRYRSGATVTFFDNVSLPDYSVPMPFMPGGSSTIDLWRTYNGGSGTSTVGPATISAIHVDDDFVIEMVFSYFTDD
ncbi:sialidase family protein [Nitratireductor soli]|uniref:sialidase family protein n=1 Tax=Nitratireductor soli TaxID=1670619 RepID=UPI00065E274B|nr:sialidase family protein [Nitratireductor soli]